MKKPRDYRAWTNREIEADSEGYVAAQQAYRDDRESSDRQRQEADDERLFTEAFVSNGGRERDAAAAYKAHRNQQAAEAATKAEASVLADARRRIRQAL
jgi:hypothetical protein